MKSGQGNNNNKNKYNRNRSFGSGGGTGNAPASPKRNNNRGGQPARRSASHDPKEPFIPDDDGFTQIGNSNKKKQGNNNNNTPRGRMNPTSSFTRPRNNNSNHNKDDRNKPRATGSFKKGRNNNSSQNLHGSASSFDGLSSDNRNTSNVQRRANSFHRPRPNGSFNAKNGNNNNNNNNNNRNNNSNNNNNNAAANDAAAKRELYRRSTSRLTAYDVELYTQGDGKSPPQRNVVRLHVDVLMRARLTHLDTPTCPEEGVDIDVWNPHHKCLWNDPGRCEQIQQIMTKYPNAIPLHLKKRTRIKSSKLGDATLASASASVVTNETGDASERDDISLGGSIFMGSATVVEGAMEGTPAIVVVDDEDMNPLRKTLMVLNKLSWTTIDKLTPILFQTLEEDVAKLMPPTTIVNKPQNNNNSGEEANNAPEQQPQQQQPAMDVSPMQVTILTMIVEKSQTEPHFSAMYAQLCKNLAERNKHWKKKILAHCQSEFEHDTAWHIARLDERLEAKAAALAAAGESGKQIMDDASANTTATEDMDRDYQVLQLRKKYKGHVQFLGELFKLGLIKLDIMIWCMSRLLFHKEQADEDDFECFAKLMTVVGEQAESLVKKGKCHPTAEEKWYQCWDRVYLLTGRSKKMSSIKSAQQEGGGGEQKADEDKPIPKISSRIKFMLVDLLDLQENGWEHRRKQENAKTIAEIHEEVREEEAAAFRRSYSDDWGGSSNGGRSSRRRVNSDDYKMSSPYSSKPLKDADGFTAVPPKRANIRRAVSDDGFSGVYNKRQTQPKRKKPPAPVPSSPVPSSPVPSSPTNRSKTVISQIDVSNATPKIVEFPDPEECRNKTKTILKEYFIGGDTTDAILSIDELVGAGRDNEGHGSVERGAAVIEAGVLLVLEMKQQEVQKFLAVIKRCLQQKKLENSSLPLGLKDPLEFLRDLEIDAPLARSLLTSIVAYWVRQEVLSFTFLLDAPEYFRTDGKPAEFAAGVLKVRGGDVTEEDLSVVEKLMTEDDKAKYDSVKEMVTQNE